MQDRTEDLAKDRTTDFEAVFRASRSALLILDTDLKIVDANPAYLRATARDHDELVGRRFFEAFPENPDAAQGDGAAELTASLRRVLERAEPDAVPFLRYDIPAVDGAGFTERYWSAFTSPLRDHGGTLAALLHQVEDVTPLHLDCAEDTKPDTAPDGALPEDAARQAYVAHAATAARRFERLKKLEREIAQLKFAQTSRATIDQAIGVIVAERRIEPDDAFEVLVALSQRTNVKLRDVATTLVRRAAGQTGERPGP